MKIYVCHSCGFDYVHELYDPLRNSILNKEHDIFLPHEGENATINTTEIIKNSDVVIAEVSLPSTGQGIELGRAELMEKRVICVYKKGSEFSNAVKFVTNEFIEYDSEKDLIEKLLLVL